MRFRICLTSLGMIVGMAFALITSFILGSGDTSWTNLSAEAIEP